MSQKETVGDILCQIEVLVNKLFDEHGFQWGDWLWNQFGWLQIHRPHDQEKYVSGGNPQFKYGPKPNRKMMIKKLAKLLKTWEDSRLDEKTAKEVLKLIDTEYR